MSLAVAAIPEGLPIVTTGIPNSFSSFEYCIWPPKILFKEKKSSKLFIFSPVFRIHDILVWTRIRGSMPLTNGSGSFFFHRWPSRHQHKPILKKVFLLITVEGTFTSFFKDKKSKRSHKTVDFPYCFCLMIEGFRSKGGAGSESLTNGSGSGSRRPKNIRIRIRNTGNKSSKLFIILL